MNVWYGTFFFVSGCAAKTPARIVVIKPNKPPVSCNQQSWFLACLVYKFRTVFHKTGDRPCIEHYTYSDTSMWTF